MPTFLNDFCRSSIATSQLRDVIACARNRGGCVVTEEGLRPNAARIPNVCQHFGIDWTNVEGFLAHHDWEF